MVNSHQGDLERARLVFNAQPFSALVGAALVGFSPGSAELCVPIRRELEQQHGFVHGGVLSYLADNALTCAGASVLGDVLTVEFKINYLRPARGDSLIGRARVVHGGKKQAVCSCEIFAVTGQQERLCAVAQGTVVRVEAVGT